MYIILYYRGIVSLKWQKMEVKHLQFFRFFVHGYVMGKPKRESQGLPFVILRIEDVQDGGAEDGET